METADQLQSIADNFQHPARYLFFVRLHRRYQEDQQRVLRYLDSAAKRGLPLATEYGMAEWWRLFFLIRFCRQQISLSQAEAA